jgi:hypothetical protein
MDCFQMKNLEVTMRSNQTVVFSGIKALEVDDVTIKIIKTPFGKITVWWFFSQTILESRSWTVPFPMGRKL